MANNKDPDKITHNLHKTAFHQGLHCLLGQNPSSEKEIQDSFEIITCDSSIYIMDHPDFTVSNVMENSIGLKRVSEAIIYCKNLT